MANMRNKRAYEVTWLIRRLFRAMSQEADRYLKESGLTAADRAVMEFLYPDEKLTVPAIADRYDVSRQHVQVIANGLQENGVLVLEPNPKHKRSSLLCLSPSGRGLSATNCDAADHHSRRHSLADTAGRFADISRRRRADRSPGIRDHVAGLVAIQTA